MQSYLLREFPFIITVCFLLLRSFSAHSSNETFLHFENSENQMNNTENKTDDRHVDSSSIVVTDLYGDRNLSLLTNEFSAIDFNVTAALENNSRSSDKSDAFNIIFTDTYGDRDLSHLVNEYSILDSDVLVVLENNSRSSNKSDDSNVIFMDMYHHSNLSLFTNGYPVFGSNATVSVENNSGSWSKSILEIQDLHMLEADRPNETDIEELSVYSTFNGFSVFDNGTSLYIEPLKNQSDVITSINQTLLMNKANETELTQTTNDSRICHENDFCGLLHCNRETKRRISCYLNSNETGHDLSQDFETDRIPVVSKKDGVQYQTKNALCYIRITGDSSYYALHNFDSERSISEIRLIFEQVNRFLSLTDFDGDGQQDNLSLRIQGIFLKEASNISDDYNGTRDFTKLVDDFREVPQHQCLSILFVAIPTDSDFVSTAYVGGICKHNRNESDLARNIALVNLVDRHGYKKSLFATAWTVAMVVGHLMGSADNECDPMLPFPPEKHWTSFFSDCGRQNIADKLITQGTCLKYPEMEKYIPKAHLKPTKIKQKILKSLCGNGRVDPGEECDCGTKEHCKKMRSCCVPPGTKRECHYDRSKGYECDWTEDCCARSCEIVPKSWNLFCGRGDASCAPEGSYCTGKSSRCPVSKTAAHLMNGQRCSQGTSKQAGAATCQYGQCNSTICMDAGLEDCMCTPSSKHQCRVCCRHTSAGRHDPRPCIPAEYFNLNSQKEKYFYRQSGTLCSEVRLGHCDGRGNCVQLGMAQSSAVQWIMRRYPFIIIGAFSYWMFSFWFFELYSVCLI